MSCTTIDMGLLRYLLSAIVALIFFLGMQLPAQSAPIAKFDFTSAREAGVWRPAHDISASRAGAQGLIVTINGEDPYLIGPRRDYPANVPLRVSIRLKSEAGGSAQLFYFSRGATEEASVRFDVPAGKWSESKLDLPALGKNYRLRFDPPGDHGTCILASLRVEARKIYVPPQWPKPTPPDFRDGAQIVTNGSLELRHDIHSPMGFEVEVNHQPIAIGLNKFLIGYEADDKIVWLHVDSATHSSVSRSAHSVREITDLPDGQAHWRITRTYSPANTPGAIDVDLTCQVDQDRQVLFLPLLGILPGASSFGESKTQALLPGLEYLDNEPSSSEADIIGPGSRRQVPDSQKITFPMMCVCAGRQYVGLIWEPTNDVAALFDSPDRQFHSGGHLMGLIYPGANGSNRIQGDLLPRQPTLLPANQPIHIKATIIAGKGASVVDAIKKYVDMKGLPPQPKVNFGDYLRTAGTGWLDSKIRQGNEYSHAFPGHFDPHPAADAAMDELWLAEHLKNSPLAQRLRDAAQGAIGAVPSNAFDSAAVGHVRFPAQSLIFGHVDENADAAAAQGRALLSRFEPDGTLLYHPNPGGEDLGRMHFAKDSNGQTAQHVAMVLQCASVSGDRDLINQGIRLLHAMDKFDHSVPRGAQTWEVPLHTPDILASAYLVRAYTLGYELTGEKDLLDRAIDWAWTGLPFVYLTDPQFDDDVTRAVGPFSSPPVFGATHWQAPNWMGKPVQWCALVYADALYRLQRYDSNSLWKQFADGITASGIQQTFPIGSDKARVGLLPDSFNLNSQSRNDPAINPATVQADAVRLFGGPPLYDFYCFRKASVMLHVPGAITSPNEQHGQISFAGQSWTSKPYYILLSGLTSEPKVLVDGHPMALAAPNEYNEQKGRLILQLHGPTHVRVSFDAGK